MNKISFLFVISIFLTFAFMSGDGAIPIGWQVGIAMALMALVGIPHGAIDHVLFMEESTATPLQFYTFYLGLIALYTAAWLLAPALSMAIFLALSAYHFGQSQFAGYSGIPASLKKAINITWGVAVISGLVYFNFEEIVTLAQTSPDITTLLSIFSKQLYFYLLVLSTFVTVALVVFCGLQNYIKREKLFGELYVLALIQICFFLTPLLIGFTLYFAILHSLKVLGEEFEFLRIRRPQLSLQKFIGMLIPFTTLSLIGTAAIIALSSTGVINISEVLLVLILISVLTLPHSIVMNGFYDKMFGKTGMQSTSDAG